MPISSSWIIGIVISVIIVVLAIVIIIIAGKSDKSGDLSGESTNSGESDDSPYVRYSSKSEELLIKRPTPWTKYRNPFTKKYIDSFSSLSPSVRKAYTLESLKSILAANTIIKTYNDHLNRNENGAYAKWHAHTYAYPKGMILFKAISDNMPDEINLGFERKAVLLKEDGKILATFPTSDVVNINVSQLEPNKSENTNNPVLIDNNSWFDNFRAIYFETQSTGTRDPIMPILPGITRCGRNGDGSSGCCYCYNGELWADYTRKLAKVQSETELSRKITREELKSWYNNNKFKFIPNEIDFNSFDISGNIEIPYFPVAMYMVVESNDSTESYTIGDIKKYITPTSDTNLDLDYLKSKVTEMKNHLDTSHYNHVFPIGSIVFFITDNNLTNIIKDEGNTFIKCNGQECNGEEYPELLSKIGNKDNSIKFNVPNLMDKVIVIGDDITGGSNTEKVSGKIESIKYDILKQTSYDKNNETSKNKSKVFTRFNEELSKRGPIATGATTDDRKTYGLITGPTSIWYKSSKLGTETKPINMKGLNQILSGATVEFDKKMINHLYVIPYIVADEYE